jgi:hypothetical protein
MMAAEDCTHMVRMPPSKKEQERAEDAPTTRRCKEVDDCLVVRQIHCYRIFSQCGEPEEHEREPENEFAKAAHAILAHIRKCDAESENRPHEATHVELETENRHNPRCSGGADVCAHDYGNRLRQCQEPCVYKAHGHHGCCGRGLYGGGDEGASQKAAHAMLGHGAENSTEVSAGSFCRPSLMVFMPNMRSARHPIIFKMARIIRL